MDSKKPEISNITSMEIDLPRGMIENYGKDQLFGPIYNVLQGKPPNDETQRERVERLAPNFELNGYKLYYCNKLCIPRANVPAILWMAHDGRVSGKFPP